jgi:DNA polymerase-3 subunit beta
VKFCTKGGCLGDALTVAALCVRAIGPARIVVGEDGMSIAASDGKVSIVVAVAGANVVEPGRVAVAIDRLVALVSCVPTNALISISTTETAALIVSGNSRSRMPLVPWADLAPVITIADNDEIGRVELSDSDCVDLFAPLVAAGSEKTRFVLASVFWQTVGGRLYAVSSNGYKLMKVSVPAGEFSQDRTLVIATEDAITARRIIKQARSGLLTLRRSQALLSINGPTFTFTTRLIDHAYPGYEHLLPPASPISVTCVRSELLASAARLRAVSSAEDPLVAISWTGAGQLDVCLARQPHDASDAIAAEVVGTARIAVPLAQFTSMLGEFKDRRVRLEAQEPGPLVIRGETPMLGVIARADWRWSGA